MKFTYIALEIIEFVGSYGTHYLCTLYDHGARTCSKLDVDEARKIQWELLKRGATKTCEYNPYKPHVYTRRVCLMDF